MFVHAEVQVDAGFEAAMAGLQNVAAGGWLTEVSSEAYDASLEGLSGLTRVGPGSGARWMSKLVHVNVRDVVVRDDRAILTFRWEATGPGGGLFPALDADITLSPAEGGGCLLALDGAYRPPLGALGAGLDKIMLSRMAAPTARSLLRQIANSILRTAGGPEQDQEQDSREQAPP